jgi:TRAP-type C4-dicarboxylate transport system substrate-binding protein
MHASRTMGRAGVPLAALLSLALAMSACGGSETDKAGGPDAGEPVVLTLANMDTDPTNIDSPDFIAAVERASGGSIRIDETHGWRSDAPLGEQEQRTIEDVRAGKVDLAVIPARAWDTVGVTSFQALVAPFLVDSADLERRVVESEVAARMLEGVEPLGLAGLALLPGALRYPLGVSKPLLGPADYEGATIGIRPSGVAELTFRALGGEAEVFAPGSLAGLDGAELDPVTIAFVRYDEQSTALTANVVLWPRAVTIVMNRKAFDALSDTQQAVLATAGREAIEGYISRWADHDGLLGRVCNGGHFQLATASAGDREALRAAVQPVYEELERDPVTRELIASIEAMRGQELLAGAESLRCADEGAAASAGSETSPELEGRWEATLSRDELVQAGAVSPETARNLAGDWALELGDGTIRALNADTDTVGATGTYSVEGAVMTIVWQEGTGITPGSSNVLGWSVYRDSLRFSAVPGGEPMFALTIKPFRRAG